MHSNRFGNHIFLDDGDYVAVRDATAPASDAPSVRVGRGALRGYVLRTLGDGYDVAPSRLRALLLPEDEVSVFTTQPGWALHDAFRDAGDGVVAVRGPAWNERDGASETDEFELRVPMSTLRHFVLCDLANLMVEQIEGAGSDATAEILVLLLGGSPMGGGTERAESSPNVPGEGLNTARPASWQAPKAEERADYETIYEALEDLRSASSSLVSEIHGTTMHLRACRRLSEMRGPIAKAWCALHNRPYVPVPDEDD